LLELDAGDVGGGVFCAKAVEIRIMTTKQVQSIEINHELIERIVALPPIFSASCHFDLAILKSNFPKLLLTQLITRIPVINASVRQTEGLSG
jgi:hypothetical protein